jgi:hypothetical protein
MICFAAAFHLEVTFLFLLFRIKLRLFQAADVVWTLHLFLAGEVTVMF